MLSPPPPLGGGREKAFLKDEKHSPQKYIYP